MTTYKIERWDSVLLSGEVPRPMIYVKADDNLVKLLEKTNTEKNSDLCGDHNNLLKVMIKDSNSSYDNWQGSALLKSSSNYPNNRPNFFEKHGYYIFILDTTWTSYPVNSGEVVVLGMEPPAYVEFVEGYDTPAEDRENKEVIEPDTESKLNKQELYAIGLGVISLIYLLYISRR